MDIPNQRTGRARPRVKGIDWQEVKSIVDSLPPDETAYVGQVDQTIRTHLRKGRYAYIDPTQYEFWTESVDGSRTRAHLFMRRRV